MINRSVSAFQNSFANKSMRQKRLLLFKVIALLLPLVLLVLVELGLRLFGYGYDLQLFTEDQKNNEFLVMNKHASKKYFTEEENATIGNFEKFKKYKDANTFRIFVLGESTTIGYPYMHNGSFHRWLQYRLMLSCPDINFEVINLSLTAVNSYTVQDFAKQIVPYEPDAVLIYVGHNEYYGALGVGSTSYIGSKPYLIRAMLELREFRLVQLLSNIVSNIRRLIFTDAEQSDLRENLMKRMAAEQQVPFESEVFENGIYQFESNLKETLSALEKHQIPVFISNLVSNEKDLKPFISDTTENQRSAISHFLLATKAYDQAEFDQAKQHFQQAKELDMLRFRAPEAINTIINDEVEAFQNVNLVDTKALFEAHSPHGILGQETLLEHVHPNLLGYALLSEAFYQALKKQRLIKVEDGYEITFEELRQEMPVTLVDSLAGAYEIMMLKEGWPFNEPISEEIKVKQSFESKLAGGLSVKQISWSKAMQQLYNFYLKENHLKEALKVAEALLLENPYDPTLYIQAGKLNIALEAHSSAVFYLKKAFALKPNLETAKSLFVILLKLDQPEEASQYLNFAVANQPENVSLSELQILVNQIIALKDRYDKDHTDVQLTNQIAAAYLKFANTSAASIYVEKSLKLAHDNPIALALQEKIQEIKN